MQDPRPVPPAVAAEAGRCRAPGAERRDVLNGRTDGRTSPARTSRHLPLIGVEPVSQGRGLGSARLRQVLAMCDENRAPAYLEATTPRNAALYERLKVLGNIEVADAPPIVPMKREPRLLG